MQLFFEMLFFVPSYLLKYLKSRTFILLMGLVAYLGITTGFSSDDTLGVLMLAFFAVMPWSYFNAKQDYKNNLLADNLELYKENHPDSVSGRGRVRCYSCGGDRIFVRKIRDQTYMQEHVCTQCGKTLYHSKEG